QASENRINDMNLYKCSTDRHTPPHAYDGPAWSPSPSDRRQACLNIGTGDPGDKPGSLLPGGLAPVHRLWIPPLSADAVEQDLEQKLQKNCPDLQTPVEIRNTCRNFSAKAVGIALWFNNYQHNSCFKDPTFDNPADATEWWKNGAYYD